jgi:Ca2+-binding EF-hand superfamily protein
MRWLALLFVLATAAGLSFSANDKPKPAPAQDAWAPDVQDVVFLGDTRPILFRFHLTVDGKASFVRWNETMTRLFKYLDRDENSVLDKQEVARMASDSQLGVMFQGNSNVLSPSAPVMADLDLDSDGKVSYAEFLRYHVNSGYGPVRVIGSPGQATQSRSMTQMLFRLLDTNKDGKLSRLEMDAGWRVLQRYDENDDELITTTEMQTSGLMAGGETMPAMPQPVNILDPRGRGNRILPAPLLVVERDENGGKLGNRVKLARDIVARYDRDKNGKLSREEVGFPKELFGQLKQSNNEVDATGLMRWMLTLPDVELAIRLGTTAEGVATTEVLEQQRKNVPMLPVKKLAGNALAMALSRTNLNVVNKDSGGGFNAARLLPSYLQQFKVADTRKKGYVTAKQLTAPEQRNLQLIFALADRDEDGKMTEQELRDYVEVTAGIMDAVTSMVYSDHGQGLFELLDLNKDGRLSQRELRNAALRLLEYDEDKDDALTLLEIPRQCQLTLSHGPTFDRNNNNQAQLVQQQLGAVADLNEVAVATDGPIWFRKMDVNGDGDVSPREFLGNPEDFAQIDKDGDGLISLAEANAADAWFRNRNKGVP